MTKEKLLEKTQLVFGLVSSVPDPFRTPRKSSLNLNERLQLLNRLFPLWSSKNPQANLEIILIIFLQCPVSKMKLCLLMARWDSSYHSSQLVFLRFLVQTSHSKILTFSSFCSWLSYQFKWSIVMVTTLNFLSEAICTWVFKLNRSFDASTRRSMLSASTTQFQALYLYFHVSNFPALHLNFRVWTAHYRRCSFTF